MYNTIYPGYVNQYKNLVQNQIKNRQAEEKTSHQSEGTDTFTPSKRQQSQNTPSNSYFPNGEKVSIDYTKNNVGMAQILKDFRNTANAIGSPDNIKSQVEEYLKFIEEEAYKENPNSKYIQSNLRNASQVLDEYITSTLKKPSKVVENWVDALFLQKINYQLEKPEVSEQQEIAEEIIEQIPTQEVQEEKVAIIEEQAGTQKPLEKEEIYVPQDAGLKRLFIQAKKYSAIDEKEKALYAFESAMDYAKEIGDEQTQALVHYEQGRIYDDFDQLSDALYNYNQAALQSNNNNVKARAHISMAKIYDDYVKINPAIDHYCAAVSFAGEADNLPLQSKALSDLAQVHAEKYDKENALMFMDLSDVIADETQNNKLKSVIASKNASSCKTLNENRKALKYYGEGASACSQIEDSLNLAKNYKSASELMLQFGNKAKAKKLMAKAFLAAQATSNDALKREISDKLARF